jgi:hypothetical protein
MYFPPGVTVSTPAVSHLPASALLIMTVLGSNCGLPSTGTLIFGIASSSKKREGRRAPAEAT